MKNYYAILEVPVGCPVTEIRAAYRRLVQENLWNKETFAELKEAYEVLTSPARRSEYDRITFGETFPQGDESIGNAAAPSGITVPRGSARQCPMGAATQCPVLTARVPLQETFCPDCGFLLAALAGSRFETVAVPDPLRRPRLEDAAGHLFTLRSGINTVGREAADVLLPDKTVSRRHAQVTLDEGGAASVEDLGSTNGTRVGGETLALGQPRLLSDGDPVQFGSVALTLRLPSPSEQDSAGDAEPAADEEPSLLLAGARDAEAHLVGVRGTATATVPLVPGVTTFGRRSENSVVLQGDPYVSGQHAQIIAEDDTFRLTDVGSTNGTLVNGKPLPPNQPHTLANGDEVIIGSAAYRFERMPRAEPDTPPVAEAAQPTQTEGEEAVPPLDAPPLAETEQAAALSE